MNSPQAKTGLEVERLIEEIQQALDAQPTSWDYDSNQTPFYNDAEGNSRGGDNDGTYCLYGPDFFIDGERYEGPVLAERCAKKDAHYIAACNPANIRQLLAALAAERAEAVRMRKDAERYAFLRSYRHFGQVDTMLDSMDYPTLDSAVDAAMSRAALSPSQGETS